MNAVTRRSLPSRFIVWPVLWLVCLSPLLVWSLTVPDPARYLRMEGVPPGQSLYVVAKLMGLCALCLFWLQCILALARRAPVFRGCPSSDHRLHVRLGLTILVLILLHVGLFVVAASLRTGHAAWDLLLPSVGHGFYRTSVGLGAVALWLCLLAIYAGRRVARGERRWAPVHRLWPLVFGLVFLHAIAIGTESRYGGTRDVVLFMAVSLTIAGLWRVWRSRGRASQPA
ncbi:MAG: hypothetical protein ACOY82_10780 [Pseudomonadota bacterium]